MRRVSLPRLCARARRRALRLAVLSLGMLLGSSACAGSRPARTHQGGDAEGAPRLEALPSIDVDPAALTPEMRMAQLLSAECLNLAPPTAPPNLSTRAMTAWSQRELERWVRQKHERADEARKQLDLAAAQNQRQRIMAGAILGLVYEDMARTLLSLPTPAELVAEPEIAVMYADVLRGQAAPYLRQARSAYTACAGNAEQLAPLAHWSGFCTTREEQLPGSEQTSGETRVQVVRAER